MSYSDVFPFFPQRKIINVFYGPLYSFSDVNLYVLHFKLQRTGVRTWRNFPFQSSAAGIVGIVFKRFDFQFFADFDPTTRGERSDPIPAEVDSQVYRHLREREII